MRRNRRLRQHLTIGFQSGGSKSMARTPRWKVYSADNEYLASCKYIEDAARLMDSGMTIRDRHSAIVWREGSEAFSASESYDDVAGTVCHRCPKSTLAAN
jgi:post-segregation antitoxin (ccd killing protein)